MIVWIAIFVVLAFSAKAFLNIKQMSKQSSVNRPDNSRVEKEYGYSPDAIDFYNRASDLETGYSGGLIDVARAVDFYTISAEKGYPVAMYKLAQIYFEGRKRVDRDLDKARFWIVKAIEKDYPGSDTLYSLIDSAYKRAKNHQ